MPEVFKYRNVGIDFAMEYLFVIKLGYAFSYRR